MNESLPAVAKSVYIDCKKCGTERYFKVIAHTSSETAKVKCEVCGSQKSYRVSEKKPKATKPRAAKSTTPKSSSTWITLKENRGEGSAKSYSVKATFASDESLMHPKFGLGFVIKAHPSKIEVLFAEGVKELIHARV